MIQLTYPGNISMIYFDQSYLCLFILQIPLSFGLFKYLHLKMAYPKVSLSRNIKWGFPGGTVVKNPHANAGDTGSCPGPGRSHMLWSGQAREPQLLSLRVWSLCSAMGEAATVRGPHTAMKSSPRSPQLEKALAQKRRPNTAKNK